MVLLSDSRTRTRSATHTLSAARPEIESPPSPSRFGEREAVENKREAGLKGGGGGSTPRESKVEGDEYVAYVLTDVSTVDQINYFILN
jgi:hypothetical protein